MIDDTHGWFVDIFAERRDLPEARPGPWPMAGSIRASGRLSLIWSMRSAGRKKRANG
jgi:hypothetical protein